LNLEFPAASRDQEVKKQMEKINISTERIQTTHQE
jgi:hypothetical protein